MPSLPDDDITTWRWHCIMDADATGWWWRPLYYDRTRSLLHGYHALLYCMCTWYDFLLHLRLIQGPRVTGELGAREGHRSTRTYLMLLASLCYVWIFHVFHFWVRFKVPPPHQLATFDCILLMPRAGSDLTTDLTNSCKDLFVTTATLILFLKTCQYASRYKQKWYHYKKTCWWKMTFRQNPLPYVSFRWSSQLQINK